jgi:hypothetical protein
VTPRDPFEATGPHQNEGGEPDASLVAWESAGGELMLRITQPGSPGGAIRLGADEVGGLREWLEEDR